MSKLKIIFVFILVLLVAAFYYYFLSQPTGGNFEVILGSDGFSPATLIIQKGDTVTFKSAAGKDFWPASDLHPSHTIYSEFDPKQPIGPESFWSFKFNKAGEWKYHDHLFSVYRGVIKVKDRKSDISRSTDDCDNSENKGQCWEKQIENVLNEEGLNSAFELLANLYSTQQAFAQDCHSYTHQLGIAAYYKFNKDKNIDLSPKTAYCGYGFYHGFMETLLQSSGTLQEARDFCAYVGRTLAKQTTDAESACYHGIGHGTVDGGDPTAWGNPEKILNPGLKMCELVSAQPDHLYRCVTGAYNALEILSMDSKYKLEMIAKNPFGICESQKEDYKEPCYTNMLPALMRNNDEDFTKVAKIVSEIPNKDNATARMLGLPTRQMVTLSLFYDYVRANFQKSDYAIGEGVKICQSLKSDLRLPCIEGLSGSYMKYGEPGKEYIKGLAFCGSDLLSKDEKDTCHKHILNRLRIWYSSDMAANICESVNKEYQNLC